MTFAGDHAQRLVVDLHVPRDVVLTGLRHELAALLADLGEDHLYDVQLVVTELVSNVLDHTTGSGRLRLFRTDEPCVVTVEVDDDSATQPVYGHSRLGENRGRGMVMVESATSKWGTSLRPGGGKTVFAVVPCP
ncbi:ATP-binding protein [Lentzea sp. NPDC058450]|uniref:ATP-binding protein n=1 Tax=Lentzea sp. NPDC058450 TaxID=3346505 RepID=UPI00364B6312